jgi:hypothetical protein
MSTTIITLDPTLKRSETIYGLLSREDYVNTSAEKALKYQDRIKLCVGPTVEAMSSFGRDVKVIKPPTSGLVSVFEEAYSNHLNLKLTPDVFWFTILQGFNNHVELNSEALRGKLVNHAEGKIEINIELPGYVKGNTFNPWDTHALPVFNKAIGDLIKPDPRALFVEDTQFTTTGLVQQTAFNVAVMSVFKSYFDYSGTTCCGIPTVILGGSVEDWKLLKQKVQKLMYLGTYEYEEYVRTYLIPVVDKLVRSVEEPETEETKKFWEECFKVSGGSGGPYLSGWVVDFFPYVRDYRNNLHVSSYLGKGVKNNGFGGPTTNCFGSPMVTVPWKWNYYSQVFDMEFTAGIISLNYEEQTNIISPDFGWYVKDITKE